LRSSCTRRTPEIERNAGDADGFYLRAWDGSMAGIRPCLISVDGAALEALAWTAGETASS
jgi:hypothetical protein